MRTLVELKGVGVIPVASLEGTPWKLKYCHPRGKTPQFNVPIDELLPLLETGDLGIRLQLHGPWNASQARSWLLQKARAMELNLQTAVVDNRPSGGYFELLLSRFPNKSDVREFEESITRM